MIVVLIFLVAMSSYFSATETAFSSLNRVRLKSKADAGNRRATLALEMEEDFDRLLSTILIGNNIVNITATTIGTVPVSYTHLDVYKRQVLASWFTPRSRA